LEFLLFTNTRPRSSDLSAVTDLTVRRKLSKNCKVYKIIITILDEKEHSENVEGILKAEIHCSIFQGSKQS